MNMAKRITDIIPSREECEKLMVKYSMRPNIVNHSIQVMNVSLAITDNLKNGVSLNRDLVIAAALLHDITKTRSLETNERHDISGGELLREMGFISVAEIVEQHVILQNFNPRSRLEEKEIIFYADKRVTHDKIVTIDERVHYLIHRYGDTEEIRKQIFRNKNLVLAVENKISDFMKIDINRAIDKLTQSILAKDFRGELVAQDPNDEHASELLKKIKEKQNNSERKNKNSEIPKKNIKKQERIHVRDK